MGLIENIRSSANAVRFAVRNPDYARKIADLYTDSANQGHEPDFFDKDSSIYNTNSSYMDSIIGITDSGVSPIDLFDLINKDTYFTGLFEQIIESLFKNGFYIEVMKDEDGELLGSKVIAKELEDGLKSIEYEEKIKKQINGDWGDGGGNVLLFTSKDKVGKLQINVEPFLDAGQYRVRVFGDSKKKVITKYNVVTPEDDVVYTIDPLKNFYKHIRYSQAGNYKFSNNPAKRAVYWYILKKYLAGSNLATFKNGLQDNVIGTPDYTALSDLVNAMSSTNTKVSSDAKKEYLRDPIAFLAKQSKLDTEILRGLTGKAKRSNSFLKLKMPYKFQKISRTNAEMKTIDFINMCDEQMGYALRTSKGVISTKDSKYANAEIESDNWKELVLDSMKSKIEKITEEFYLPVLFGDYNPEIYKVKFGRDVSEEDIKIFEAKTNRNSSIATILTQLVSVPDAKYDFETDTIVPLAPSEKKVKNTTTDNTPTNDDIVEDNDNKGKRVKKKDTTISEKAVASSQTVKIKSSFKKATKKQLEAYVKKLSKKKSIQDALDSFDKDFKTINYYGVNVNTFSQQLQYYGRVAERDTKKELLKMKPTARFNQRAITDIVQELLDTKAQLIIKGWDSLDLDQQNLITKYYGEDYRGYKGIDDTLSEKIQKQLEKDLEELQIKEGEDGIESINNVTDKIMQTIPTIAGNRANLIARNEASQNIEATRKMLMEEAGADQKSWHHVNDMNVRPDHIANAEEGWILMDQTFQNGAQSPAEEVACRCSLSYRNSSSELFGSIFM